LLDASFHLQFDKILCDVPCSGDGLLRRAPAGWASWSPALGVHLHEVQAGILTRSLELLASGGRLVYSTCSLNPLENEAVMSSS
jgi:multisite-specific tRNA:(cytosine-C5)-methyltransferase